jgi:hypothetical protein
MPKQYVRLFTAGNTDLQVKQLFAHHLGTLCGTKSGGSVFYLPISSKYLLCIIHFLSVCDYEHIVVEFLF